LYYFGKLGLSGVGPPRIENVLVLFKQSKIEGANSWALHLVPCSGVRLDIAARSSFLGPHFCSARGNFPDSETWFALAEPVNGGWAKQTKIR